MESFSIGDRVRLYDGRIVKICGILMDGAYWVENGNMLINDSHIESKV